MIYYHNLYSNKMFAYIKINCKFELNGDWHCIYEYHFLILIYGQPDKKLVLKFCYKHKIIRNLQTKPGHNLQTQNYP